MCALYKFANSLSFICVVRIRYNMHMFNFSAVVTCRDEMVLRYFRATNLIQNETTEKFCVIYLTWHMSTCHRYYSLVFSTRNRNLHHAACCCWLWLTKLTRAPNRVTVAVSSYSWLMTSYSRLASLSQLSDGYGLWLLWLGEGSTHDFIHCLWATVKC